MIFKRNINLDSPETFCEKIQWLKLHDRNPLYTKLVDKYEVKQYVADKIGEDYIIPTIGVWDSVDEIDFDNLPNQFVLKCTHDSGGLVVCKDKNKLNIKETKKKLRHSLKQNFYYFGREWPYKNVKPRIIAEKYMVDSKMGELRDYKFFCFGGQVKCYKIDFDRFIEHHANYYDMDNNILNFGEEIIPPKFNKEIEIPKTVGKMKQLAEQLSKETPFMRTDFYDVDGNIYFGELTFYPGSGCVKFTDEESDRLLGSWIKLSNGGY
jgi:hypothetical protein